MSVYVRAAWADVERLQRHAVMAEELERRATLERAEPDEDAAVGGVGHGPDVRIAAPTGCCPALAHDRHAATGAISDRLGARVDGEVADVLETGEQDHVAAAARVSTSSKPAASADSSNVARRISSAQPGSGIAAPVIA